MSNPLNWQSVQVDPPQPMKAQPSANVAYKIFNMGTNIYMASVEVTRGVALTTHNLGEDLTSISDAQAVCQTDWDSGIR